MKNQALFSLKDKSKISKCCLLQFLVGALRVNNFERYTVYHHPVELYLGYIVLLICKRELTLNSFQCY